MRQLLDVLNSDATSKRNTAIQALGEIGDAEALTMLRQRTKLVNQELVALVTAVGRSKKKMNVK